MINISKLYCDKSGSSDELRYPPQRGIKPVVILNCTARCNLRCLHCYSDSDCATNPRELTTLQAKTFIQQVADYGCPVLLFSGGEPLMREDVFELISFAKTCGLRTALSTNGTLINQDIAKRLYDTGLSYVGISLDGPKEIHEAFRGQKGCFDKTMKAFEYCMLAGVKTGLRCTMTRQNIGSVGEIFDIAEQNGIRRICFYHLVRCGRAEAEDLRPAQPHQIREALDEIISRTAESVIRKMSEEVLTVGNHADGPYLLLKMQRQQYRLADTARELLLRSGGNRTGQNIAAVSWDGSVHPDQFWRNYSIGNVLEKSFGQIWDNQDDPVLKILRNKDTYKAAKCARCKWFDLCKGNFRCPSGVGDVEDWFNEPACYLTEEEIAL
jgi:radical SAM protein with 4Fe4S-binding SPASM domain